MNQHKVREMTDKDKWPKEILLTIGDRLWLFALLPKEGDISSLRTLRELKEELNTSPEEDEKYEVKTLPNGVQINPKWLEDNLAAETERSFSFGPKAWELIKTTLVQLSMQKKLSINCISLYETFCEPPPTGQTAAALEPHVRLDPESSIPVREDRERAIKPVSAEEIARAAKQ